MHHGPTIKTDLFTVQLVIGDEPQDFYVRWPDGRYFVAGVPKADFHFRVQNTSGSDIELISTVDGRNTQKTEPGDVVKSRGVLVPAGEWRSIYGFETGTGTVLTFQFGGFGGSVSELLGDAEGNANTGVFGLAAYRGSRPVTYRHDKIRPPARFPNEGFPVNEFLKAGPAIMSAQPGESVYRERTTRSVRGAGGISDVEELRSGSDMATHVGHELPSQQGSKVDFQRSGEPTVLAIGYASLEVLQQPPVLSIWAPRDPDPFPGIPTGYGDLRGRG